MLRQIKSSMMIKRYLFELKETLYQGSFGIPFEVIQYAGSVDVLATVGLIANGASLAAGCAIEAFKRLKGRKIDSIKALDDGISRINVGEESFDYSDRVIDLITHPSFRSSISKSFVAPVEEGKITSIKFINIESGDTLELQQDELSELNPSSEIYSKSVNTDEFEATIRFIAANVGSDTGWLIRLHGRQRSTEILDEEFLSRLESPYGSLKFGLPYRVIMRETRTSRIGGRATKSFAIMKVIREPALEKRPDNPDTSNDREDTGLNE